MKNILTITLGLLMTFSASAHTTKEAHAAAPSQDEKNAPNGKVLIVYFSRTGENYGVGTVSVGNTAMMASYIQEFTDGTLFEIVPSVPYPTAYEATKVISQKERNENLRPAIKNPLENLNDYSVVFIGSPVWYGGQPMIMQTFYETYPALAEKTIVPFGTHEGSGISSFTPLLRRYFPKATIKESLGLTGVEVRNSAQASRKAVSEWIKKMNLSKPK